MYGSGVASNGMKLIQSLEKLVHEFKTLNGQACAHVCTGARARTRTHTHNMVIL
jgi:hypothetical protein